LSVAFSAYLDHIRFLTKHDNTRTDGMPYLARSDVSKLRLKYIKVLRTTSVELCGGV